MAIKSDWIVASTTARNALAVTDGDVAAGYEAKVLADGRIYRAILSGSGSTCWSNSAPFEVGTWTPTCTAVTNLDSVTGFAGQYMRVGNIVSATFGATVDATAAAAISFTATLPVASDFSGSTRARGVASGAPISGGRVYSSAADDEIVIDATATSTSASSVYVIFMYEIE